jgi:hypothetical protein
MERAVISVSSEFISRRINRSLLSLLIAAMNQTLNRSESGSSGTGTFLVKFAGLVQDSIVSAFLGKLYKQMQRSIG